MSALTLFLPAMKTCFPMNASSVRRPGSLLLALGLCLSALSLLSSCNTTRGFGRDVQIVGDKIERKAAQVQSGR